MRLPIWSGGAAQRRPAASSSRIRCSGRWSKRAAEAGEQDRYAHLALKRHQTHPRRFSRSIHAVPTPVGLCEDSSTLVASHEIDVGAALVRPSDNLSDALKLLSDALQILSLRMSAIDPIRARIAAAAMRAADYAVDPAKDHVNLAADDVCRQCRQRRARHQRLRRSGCLRDLREQRDGDGASRQQRNRTDQRHLD